MAVNNSRRRYDVNTLVLYENPAVFQKLVYLLCVICLYTAFHIRFQWFSSFRRNLFFFSFLVFRFSSQYNTAWWLWLCNWVAVWLCDWVTTVWMVSIKLNHSISLFIHSIASIFYFCFLLKPHIVATQSSIVSATTLPHHLCHTSIAIVDLMVVTLSKAIKRFWIFCCCCCCCDFLLVNSIVVDSH